MAQYDVFRLKSGMLVVDLQADLIEVSRMVAPLREAGRVAYFPPLTPMVEFDRMLWIVRVQEMAAVPASQLRAPVGSLSLQRGDLKRAVLPLFDGF